MFRESPELCPFAFMVGLPIRFLRFPPDEAWRGQRQKTKNEDMSDLTISGVMPADWAIDGGSALIVRANVQDLLPEHMEVLCDFCTNKVRIIVSASMKKGDLVQGMQTLKRVATKDNFYAYFEMYRQKKVLSDERWRIIPSPYDF